jgi:hypothetical protein
VGNPLVAVVRVKGRPTTTVVSNSRIVNAGPVSTCATAAPASVSRNPNNPVRTRNQKEEGRVFMEEKRWVKEIRN